MQLFGARASLHRDRRPDPQARTVPLGRKGERILARLHVGQDGSITVLTGKVELWPRLQG